MRTSNRHRLLDYLRAHPEGVTAREAARGELDMTSVSQEITRLEQSGFIFEHIREENDATHWTRYRLVEKQGVLI